jgi:hypothetical protein
MIAECGTGLRHAWAYRLFWCQGSISVASTSLVLSSLGAASLRLPQQRVDEASKVPPLGCHDYGQLLRDQADHVVRVFVGVVPCLRRRRLYRAQRGIGEKHFQHQLLRRGERVSALPQPCRDLLRVLTA